MDAVGGPSFRRSYELLDTGGRLVAFGASAVMSGEKKQPADRGEGGGADARGFNLIKQMSASKSVIGLNMLRAVGARGHAASRGSTRSPS